MATNKLVAVCGATGKQVGGSGDRARAARDASLEAFCKRTGAARLASLQTHRMHNHLA